MKNSANQIKEIEELVKAGRLTDAANKIKVIRPKQVSRGQGQKIADLARRCSLPQIALKWLGPYVRPKNKTPIKATEEETCTYAAALSLLGASSEALELLTPIDSATTPKCLLYQAHCHFSRWEYQMAIRPLVEYVRHPLLTPYERTVGKVNLFAAYVHEGFIQDASETFSQLNKETASLGLMRGSTYEIATQLNIQVGDFRTAEHCLREARNLLPSNRALGALFIDKWEAVFQMSKGASINKWSEALASVQQRARRLRHSETIRDCDLYLAKFCDDADRLRHVYFGSRHNGYRRRIYREINKQLNWPDEYRWVLQEGEQQARVSLEKILGIHHNNLQGALLRTLCSDFYLRFSVATLHSELYPNEYFDPDSSPQKIYQLVCQFRRNEEEHSALAIKSDTNGYWLSSTKPCVIVVSRPAQRTQQDSHTRLRLSFSHSSFTANEASKVLSLSSRQTRRVLTKMLEGKAIEHAEGSNHPRRFVVK